MAPRVQATLEENYTVNTTTTTLQDSRFALEVGQYKDIYAYVRTISTDNNASTHATLTFLSSVNRNDKNTDWASAGSMTLPKSSATTFVKKTSLSGHGRWIRWQVSGLPSGKSVTFNITLFLQEE